MGGSPHRARGGLGRGGATRGRADARRDDRLTPQGLHHQTRAPGTGVVLAPWTSSSALGEFTAFSSSGGGRVPGRGRPQLTVRAVSAATFVLDGAVVHAAK